jgi:predicted secreted hydrolase
MRRFLAVLTASFLLSATEYRQAVPGYRFEFPRDHFSHPDFRTEWWYYTGNVQTGGGHAYGFELVFFRQGEHRDSQNASAWQIDDVYLAHLALSDLAGGPFRYYKRLNRGGPGLAGASGSDARIWNGNWEAKWDLASGAQTLTAVAEGIRFNLRLTAQKSPVINGENGVSQKAEGAGKASYYVSYTRLAVEGTLNGAEVSGTAWMDHEWFTHQLEASQQGWDWFSVQLENGPEFMLFQLRRKDGSIDPFSSGTYVPHDGRAVHLRREAFTLEPLEYWKSPNTGARYPVRWRITIPSLGVNLECRAARSDQELVAENGSGTTYWEGAVRYSGSARGSGYLEMTGYANRVRL